MIFHFLKTKKDKINFLFLALKKSRGAALISVLAIISLLIVMMQNISSNAQIQYLKAKNEYLDQQARYHAQSGAEVALLRLTLYKEADKMLKKTPAYSTISPYLNLIWSLPFSWPVPIKEDFVKSMKLDIEAINKQSFMQGSYNIKIEAEDGKIDINNLASPIDSIREFTFNSLLNLFRLLLLDNEELEKKYHLQDLQDLLFNLKDWIDEDNIREQGGSESNIEEEKQPLDRFFFYLEEIKEVPSMTEEIYNTIKPFITIYGTLGLQINLSSKEVLQSIFNLPEVIAENIVERSNMASSNYAPFSSLDEFCKFLKESSGGSPCEENFKEDQEPLKKYMRFNTPLHFHAQVTGSFRKSFSSSQFLIYDHFQAIKDYKEAVLEHNQALQKADEKKDNKINKKQNKTSKKEGLETQSQSASSFPPFTIIYWKEAP